MTPIPQGDPARHFYMTRSVARVMGLSLSEAMQTGALLPESYAAMITACRSCALVEACEKWLATRTEIGPGTPPGCQNAARLNQLHKRLT